MKKLWIGALLGAFWVVSAANAQIKNPLTVENLTPEWGISTANPMYITAYNLKYKLELMMLIDDLAPAGVRCEKAKVLTDVDFAVVFFKAPDKLDRNLERALRKVKIKIIRNRKTYISGAQVLDSYEKNTKLGNNQPIRLGKLLFTSPYTCHNLDDVEFVIDNIEINGREVPELRFRVHYNPVEKE